MKVLKPIEYLHLQMRLEGKSPIDPCWVRQVEIVPDEELPLVLIAQLANKELVAYYAETLSPDLQKSLLGVILSLEFPKIDSLLGVLKAHTIPVEVGYYKTYTFASKPTMNNDVLCLSKSDTRVKTFGFDGFAQQIYAIEQHGMLVSACVSTRENETRGEAWIYTMPEYRNQGFAQKAVRGWARGLMDAGKIPFYSHQIANIASANLARKLELLPVYEEITITQM